MVNPRAEYSPIFERVPLKLPGNARIAVWPVINVEEWDIKEPMARAVLPTPQGVSVLPDVPNFGWYDYGMRVGFWRLKRVLDQHQIRATVSLNAAVLPELSCPGPAEPGFGLGVDGAWLHTEGAESGIGRARSNPAHHKDDQGVLRSGAEGLDGSGLAETFDTPDILAEEGIEYVCDWCNDDQPYPMKVKSAA